MRETYFVGRPVCRTVRGGGKVIAAPSVHHAAHDLL